MKPKEGKANMTHPVFFSFAGDAKQYAERLKGKFSDEIVYMYSRTGVDGVDFPQEILEEIAQCQLFVVFWSAAYIDADVRRPWCRRELITAAKRVSSGSLTNYIIIPIDSTPLESLIKDPDTGETSDVLQPMRETRRAFSVPVAWKAVETEIARELAHFSDAALPELFRADLQRQLRESIENGSYQTKAPVTFVSGFHGSGRKTLIRGLMQADFRHLTEHRLGIDGSDGPEDFLQLVWGEVLQKTIKEQRAFLKAAHRNPDLLKGYFRQLGPQLQSRRAYLVISKDDVTDFADVVPHWFADYFPLITPTVQPLIFVVISRTLPPI
ncbi:MAG: toll/interleukin-1 receptor domain-containing protein, partial [Burkholderiaceae bacterium]|nr:toll/interleukin-1 receptor domain-containing protein [Burkholderiaceae bacterium]